MGTSFHGEHHLPSNILWVRRRLLRPPTPTLTDKEMGNLWRILQALANIIKVTIYEGIKYDWYMWNKLKCCIYTFCSDPNGFWSLFESHLVWDIFWEPYGVPWLLFGPWNFNRPHQSAGDPLVNRVGIQIAVCLPYQLPKYIAGRNSIIHDGWLWKPPLWLVPGFLLLTLSPSNIDNSQNPLIPPSPNPTKEKAIETKKFKPSLLMMLTDWHFTGSGHCQSNNYVVR